MQRIGNDLRPARRPTTRSPRRSKAGEPSRDPVDSWLAECPPGWALPGKYHSDQAIYRADLDRIWRRGWLFAGHACELSKPGDYFTLQMENDRWEESNFNPTLNGVSFDNMHQFLAVQRWGK